MKEFVEKLIGRLEEESYLVKPRGRSTTDYGDTVVDIGDAIDIVNQLAEEFATDINVVSKNGWIPCSERLPEDNTNVIACFGTGTVTELIYIGSGIFKGIYEYTTKVIIAWMPSPTPYKENENGKI